MFGRLNGEGRKGREVAEKMTLRFICWATGYMVASVQTECRSRSTWVWVCMHAHTYLGGCRNNTWHSIKMWFSGFMISVSFLFSTVFMVLIDWNLRVYPIPRGISSLFHPVSMIACVVTQNHLCLGKFLFLPIPHITLLFHLFFFSSHFHYCQV